MKEHRWLCTFEVPCKPYMNEDSEVFVRTDKDKAPWQHPLRLWCFDCEKDFSDAFGQECEGYIVPGGKDFRIPDEEWEGI